MSAEFEPPVQSGILGPIRSMIDGVFGSVEDRIELLSIELHEEKHRLVNTLIWTVAFLIVATLAVAFASFALLVAVWETEARLPVALGLAGVYLIAAVAVGLKTRKLLLNQPKPFAATLEELQTDRQCAPPNS